MDEQEVQTETPESADETAQRIWDEMQAGEAPEGEEDAAEGEEPQAEEPAAEEPTEAQDASEEEAKPEAEAPKEERKKKKRRRVYDMEADPGPPMDWSQQAKDWYEKLPEELRPGAREVARIGHEFYAWRQRLVQETNRKLQEVEARAADVEGVVKTVQRWLPRWGMQGMTPEQAISKLCTFNEGYIKNPAVALSEMAKAAGLQITIHNAPSNTPIAQNGNSAQLDPEELFSRFEQRLTERQQQAQQQYQHQTLAQSVTEALRGMQLEENEEGRLVYPDLQSEAFLQRLQPLATAFGRANPNLDWGQILRKAYQAADGRVIPRRTSQPAKLSNGIARKAARSVAGSLNGSSDLEGSLNESALETAARVFAQHFSR